MLCTQTFIFRLSIHRVTQHLQRTEAQRIKLKCLNLNTEDLKKSWYSNTSKYSILTNHILNNGNIS